MNHPWPKVKLGEVLTHYTEYIEAPEARIYPKLSVRLYGKGVVLDSPADGMSLKMKRHQIAKAGQVILSEIWGKKGAVGFVPPEGDGSLCTSHFFLFDLNLERLDPRYLRLIFTANYLEEQLNAGAFGTTGYAAVRPKHLLAANIPLPTLDDQRCIIARIEELSVKIEEARDLKEGIEDDARRMLSVIFRDITTNVKYCPMDEVAPIIRRKVEVLAEGEYAELGIRSFGKGTFHKPILGGIEVGDKKLYRIEPGDIVFNNVFAWEGAVAVAKPEDVGRFGSHRFISCVPKQGVVTANFLCFYFRTTVGLEKLGQASPRGAGRNRTLGLEALSRMEVPVPDYDKQLWFDNLQTKLDAVKKIQQETAKELNALMPSILSRAFSGEL